MNFVVYTADGGIHPVEAPSLRTALRNFKTSEATARVVACIESGCVPIPTGDERPFLAVMLRNPNYVAPEDDL